MTLFPVNQQSSSSLLLLLLLLSMLFSGCSSSGLDPDMPEGFAVEKGSLYLSRASLHSLDFEKYTFSPKNLLQECGIIRKGKTVTTHQQLFALENSVSIMNEIWQILELVQAGEAQLGAPGTGDTMFDPGRLFLQVTGQGNTLKLQTSLDEVVDAKAAIAEEIRLLVRQVRGQAEPTACGNPSFHGIGFDK